MILRHNKRNTTERDLFIGKTDTDLLQGLRRQITPELLSWCGQKRADLHSKGKVCELTVVFGKVDGQDLGMYWMHGSELQGPPPVVSQFVAVDATNLWNEQQKRMVRGDDA